MPFSVVGREEWKAVIPLRLSPDIKPPITKIILTKTRTGPCRNKQQCKIHLRQLQLFYMSKGYEDIPYSFVVSPEAIVYEGRGWYLPVPTPPKRPDLEGSSLVIAYIGSYPDDSAEHKKMQETWTHFLEHIKEFSGDMISPECEQVWVVPTWNVLTDLYGK